jgi:hypothetical protein
VIAEDNANTNLPHSLARGDETLQKNRPPQLGLELSLVPAEALET